MNSSEKISEAELEILKVLWKAEKELSENEIYEILIEYKEWNNSTVRTLIRRLTEKGALEKRKKKKFYFSPTISEVEYTSAQTKSFISKIYNGNAKNLIVSLFEENYIAEDELKELRELWDKGDEDESK